MERPTALITGATAGIGHEFARVLAGRGHDLVLVARDLDRLTTVAEALRRAHGVRVEVLPADLSERDQVERVADRMRRPDQPVEVLVNNAGYGLRRHFVTGEIAAEEKVLAVLVTAVMVLSRAAVDGMVARRRGTIVNVSSVASFISTTSYAAAKSWVTVFTSALDVELAGTGVTATAVCPGFVHTEFHQRMGVRGRVAPEWAMLSAERVVAEGLADAARGRVVSIPSRRYSALVALLRHLPLRAAARVNRRLGRSPRWEQVPATGPSDGDA